jgi:hypothetical protein
MAFPAATFSTLMPIFTLFSSAALPRFSCQRFCLCRYDMPYCQSCFHFTPRLMLMILMLSITPPARRRHAAMPPPRCLCHYFRRFDRRLMIYMLLAPFFAARTQRLLMLVRRFRRCRLLFRWPRFLRDATLLLLRDILR